MQIQVVYAVDNVDYTNCGEDKNSKALAKLIVESKNQQRKELFCNKKLALAAKEKAKAMAEANRIDHNINHITPNEWLRNFGIQLSATYQVLGNQVEAVSGGEESAVDTFNYFMTSPPHKAHLLGEKNFYLKQNQIGVGFYYDESKKHEFYWVVYITSLANKGEKAINMAKVKYEYYIEKEKTKQKRTINITNLKKQFD